MAQPPSAAVAPVEDPAEVTIEKAVVARRVHVFLRVGEEMVLAMLGRPPEDALLRRALRNNSEDELESPARFVGAVRKITVVASANGENAQPVERDAKNDRPGGHSGPDRGKADKMHKHERSCRRIDDVGRRVG